MKSRTLNFSQVNIFLFISLRILQTFSSNQNLSKDASFISMQLQKSTLLGGKTYPFPKNKDGLSEIPKKTYGNISEDLSILAQMEIMNQSFNISEATPKHQNVVTSFLHNSFADTNSPKKYFKSNDELNKLEKQKN